MLQKHGLVLTKRELDFECDGVLNPAVIYEDGKIHMFYRAVAKGNRSTIGYCLFKDPLNIEMQLDVPLLVPTTENEKHGIEDPRIVKIDDIYYLSYCGYDGENAFGCVATSTDLKEFKKHGIVVPQIKGFELNGFLQGQPRLNNKYFTPSTGSEGYVWDKNVVFFPRRINNKLYFLHRINPGIQIACVDSLEDLTPEFWCEYMLEFHQHIVLDPDHDHEFSYLGNGAPPIETPEGWILIYHGVHDTEEGHNYVACAALLDLENPCKELARLPEPLFSPDQKWELNGYVNNVCFPSGTAVIEDQIYIYYGAADESIACASIPMKYLLDELLSNKIEVVDQPLINSSINNQANT
ncbi:pesticidal protein Cry7Aa [Flavobacterium sp.]|uniref:glycoside hydrolase family 130 protein n=1 Tax=Flavobacterium sp. TaxID=239 RepID=UPI003D11452D